MSILSRTDLVLVGSAANLGEGVISGKGGSSRHVQWKLLELSCHTTSIQYLMQQIRVRRYSLDEYCTCQHHSIDSKGRRKKGSKQQSHRCMSYDPNVSVISWLSFAHLCNQSVRQVIILLSKKCGIFPFYKQCQRRILEASLPLICHLRATEPIEPSLLEINTRATGFDDSLNNFFVMIWILWVERLEVNIWDLVSYVLWSMLPRKALLNCWAIETSAL